MRKRLDVWAVSWLALVLLFCPIAQAQVVNLLTNGDFETGDLTGWGGYGNYTMSVVSTLVGAAVPDYPIEGMYCMQVVVPAAGANFWDAGVQTYYNQVFEAGKKYTFSAWLKCAAGTMRVNFKPELAQSPWTGYGEEVKTMTDEWAEYYVTTPVFSSSVSPAQISLHIAFEPGVFWLDYAQFYVGDYVPTKFPPKTAAMRPVPANGATDVARDTSLSWEPGPFAVKHDVYLGTNLDDVTNASIANPLDVLVSQGQTATVFTPSAPLEFGQTYYWRVDEVNGAPDFTVHKGPVWSFTVEPYSYPVTPIAATASGQFNMATGPSKTIDNSGMSGDMHDTVVQNMWLSSKTGPHWIQYEFDKVYKLDQLWIWNSNQAVESMVGYGVKDVEILCSEDGQDWQSLGIFECTQAPGEADYVTDIKIGLGGVMAKYIKLDIKETWGSPIASIAEVRFFQIPVAAFYPNPADGAGNVALDATLDFRPGRLAASHKVYLGTDPNAVLEGAVKSVTSTDHRIPLASFDPLYGTTYYWKVDEVNDAATPAVAAGDLWSFSTIGYAVVDDFESYDDTCRRIFFAWVDGLGHSGSQDCGVPAASGNGTGSTVGNLTPPFAERFIVNSGRQSMPFEFDNSISPFYSEATRVFATEQDWTVGGVDTLTVYLRGEPAAFVELAPGTIVMNGIGADIWGASDQFRFVYKRLVGNGSITARVDSVANTDPWAKAGVMIRETLDSASKHAFTCVTPSNGVAFQRRRETAQESFNNNQTGLAAPYWVRITRNGNTFIAERSEDGLTWTSVVEDATQSQDTITMANEVYIGLAVTSHAAGSVCGAKFSNVSTTGNLTGAWEVAEIGATQVEGNKPEVFYVVVEDGAGSKKVIVHPDPAVIATGLWERWDIPLDQLSSAGIRLNRIKRLSIGVGDRNAPKAGSRGKIYIDDIQLTRLGN